MKVSIITCALNEAAAIERTLNSVMGQDYPHIEHIVIDGRSTDDTMSIVNRYRQHIDQVISEPDNGIYDAMNKGIALAAGDVIGFLNAGDVYANQTVVSQIVNTLQNNDCRIVYGDLEYIAKNNPDKIVRRWKSKPYQDHLFRRGWHPPHPTFYAQKSVFEDFGNFDTSYNIGADYDLMLRFLKKHSLSSCYIPAVLVKMSIGGTSNGSIRNVIKANIECYRAWKKNGLKIRPLIIVRKPLSKLMQYIRKTKK